MKNKIKKLNSAQLLVIFMLILPFGYQNCSEVEFQNEPLSSTNTVEKDESNLNQNPHCDPNKPGDCNDTDQVLRSIQPTLAVSGMACLSCHAQIHANVISDFGVKKNNYWGGPNAKINSVSWHTNYVNTWQSTTIKGTLTVPDELIPTNIQSSVPELTNLPPLKIHELFQFPYKSNSNWSGNKPEMGLASMDYGITPNQGNEKIVPKSEVLIASPSEDDFFSLSNDLKNTKETSGFFRNEINREPLELKIIGQNTETYIQNDEAKTLSCKKSNVFIKGTLFLKDLKVNAIGGCRLYVTGSVFIQGPITYSSADPTENLQISSSNGIFMGLGYSELEHRMIQHRWDAELRGQKSYKERTEQALKEALLIGNNLKDALKDAPVNPATGNKDRLRYDYTRLLLNAPMVHSRYLGLFKGTIITEYSLFAVGQFRFEFDDVFTKVNVFPLLKNPILSIK